MTEAQKLAKLLGEAGLDPIPVCCRADAVDCSEIGLPKAHPDKFAPRALVPKGFPMGHGRFRSLKPGYA